jgi:hypothetical protein
MTTPTAEQIADIRLDIADFHAAFNVPEPNITRIWQRVEALGYDDVEMATRVFALYRVKSKLIGSGCDIDESMQRKLDALDALATEWKQQAGMYGGRIYVGTLDYDLDSDETNDEQWYLDGI